MTWTQVINPLGSIGLSALDVAVPIIFLFIALALGTATRLVKDNAENE